MARKATVDLLAVSAAEAARYLCVSRRTFDGIAARREIPGVQLGRRRAYLIADLNSYLLARRDTPQERGTA